MKNEEKTELSEKKYKKLLATNIQRFRQLRGLTQEKLADSLNIGIGSLAKIESTSLKTQRLPSISLLLKISTILEIPLPLFFIDNEKEINDLKLTFTGLNQQKPLNKKS